MNKRFCRQVRGELRKAASPLIAAAMIGTAAYAAFAQIRNSSQLCAPGPSPVDWTGAFRIGLDQHVTLLGFAIAALAAGLMSAEELESGASVQSFLAESSPVRIIFARMAAIAVVLGVSTLMTVVAVRASVLGLDFEQCAAGGMGSSTASAASDLGMAVVVCIFISTLVTVLALWTKSTILTMLGAAIVLTLPAYIYKPDIQQYTPTGWILNLMHLIGFGGQGIDYVLPAETHYSHFGAQSVLSLVGLISTSCLLGAWGIYLVGRRRGGNRILGSRRRAAAAPVVSGEG